MSYIILRKNDVFVRDFLSIRGGQMVYYLDGKWVDFYLQTPEFTVTAIENINTCITAAIGNNDGSNSAANGNGCSGNSGAANGSNDGNDSNDGNGSCCLTISVNDDQFRSTINQIDSIIMDANSIDIRDFVPTMKINPLTGVVDLVCLKIPIIHGISAATVYDEYNDIVPLNIIDRGFKGYAIIKPMCNGDYLVEQIKITIPEQYFDSCILTDSDDDTVIEEEEYKETPVVSINIQ